MRAASVDSITLVSSLPADSEQLVKVLFWHAYCPLTCESAAVGIAFSVGAMSGILILARKRVRSYRVLRYAKAFDFVAAVRYGLWLAGG